MAITADIATNYVLSELERFVSRHPRGSARRAGGLIALNTHAPIPPFNGVIAERADADIEVAAEMLAEIAATDVPYCLVVRSDERVEFERLARSHDLSVKSSLPLMVLEPAATSVVESSSPPGLSIRELPHDEISAHVRLAAASFGMPFEALQALLTPETLGRRGVHCYMGEVEGEPVATAIAAVDNGAVGIFNVATTEPARGRGYGRALTMRGIADGVDEGASWSFLQSSPLGLPVYLRIGYRTVETWSEYLPAGAG